MGELEVVVLALIRNTDMSACQSAFGTPAVVAARLLAGKCLIQLADGAEFLTQKLGTVPGASLLIGEEGFQSEIEAADVTRADFFRNFYPFHHREANPQPLQRVTFDRDRFDVTLEFTVFDEFVLMVENANAPDGMNEVAFGVGLAVLSSNSFHPACFNTNDLNFLTFLKRGRPASLAKKR